MRGAFLHMSHSILIITEEKENDLQKNSNPTGKRRD